MRWCSRQSVSGRRSRPPDELTGTVAFIGRGNFVFTVDATTRPSRGSRGGDAVGTADWSPDGATLAYATPDGAIYYAPDPDDPPADGDEPPEGITIVCLHCLLDDHPEIGRGLDIAREYGVADLDERGEWIVGDLAGSAQVAAALTVGQGYLRRPVFVATLRSRTSGGGSAMVTTRWSSTASVTPTTIHVTPARTRVSPASGTLSCRSTPNSHQGSGA